MQTQGFAQFGPFRDATLDSLIELGQSIATQVEKITRLQVEAGMQSSREALAATQALLSVKDPAALSVWQATYVQPNFDRAAEAARQQYAVLVETRDILADAVKQSTTDATRQIRENIERIAEGAPEGFAPLFEAIRKSLDSQVAAFDSISKVAGEFGSIAESNLEALKRIAEPAAAARRKTPA